MRSRRAVVPDTAAPAIIPRRTRGPSADRLRRSAPGSRAQRDRALFERYQDHDRVDRDAIIERFLPLARHIAARYECPDEPFDDVYQVACYGLVKAVDRFDPVRGIAFSSYAVPTILGEIKRYFRDRAWAMRVPRGLQDLSLRVERVVGDLSLERGQQPSVHDVALAIGVDPDRVREAMQAGRAHRATSLDAPRGADGRAARLGDTVGTLDHGYAGAEHRAVLQTLMRSLTLRERNVIRLRFELDLTLAEIGERIGVSEVHVSRILRSALDRLRAVAEARGAHDENHDRRHEQMDRDGSRPRQPRRRRLPRADLPRRVSTAHPTVDGADLRPVPGS
jgi:RNA polymerase sigma-B factor